MENSSIIWEMHLKRLSVLGNGETIGCLIRKRDKVMTITPYKCYTLKANVNKYYCP